MKHVCLAVVLAGGYASNGAMIQASQSDIDLSNTTVSLAWHGKLFIGDLIIY